MANFFKASNKNTKLEQQIVVDVNRLDFNGCGVGHYQNKPLFIDGALENETVLAKIIEQKSKYTRAKLIEVKTSSEHRISPHCHHFNVCGGCDLQHLNFEQHLSFKQKKVIELFARNNINEQLPWQEPIHSKPWHYRRKARIGVQFNKTGQATIGFRQKSTNHLCAIKNCPVLVEPLLNIFPKLQGVIKQLTLSKSIGHIEVIASESIAIIIRQLKPLNTQDKALWLQYSIENNWQILMDDGEIITSLSPLESMHYYLPGDIKISFEGKDFIQVNHDVNVKMIAQAMDWLDLKPTDVVLDLFCGLGNFSLPMAKIVQHVVGVEGVQSMVDKAISNAMDNTISNCSFYQADLNNNWLSSPWTEQSFDKVLLDPARAGAFEALTQLVKSSIKTILYISCDPITLARDSKLLLTNGYIIKKISIMEMFAQTKHIETMILFTKS